MNRQFVGVVMSKVLEIRQYTDTDTDMNMDTDTDKDTDTDTDTGKGTDKSTNTNTDKATQSKVATKQRQDEKWHKSTPVFNSTATAASIYMFRRER